MASAVRVRKLSVQRQAGFSLFELCVVLIVISILIYSSYHYYVATIEDSKSTLIKHQAATFARTVENLHGQARLLGANRITLESSIIYFNEKGWPASAGEPSSVKTYNQTPEECEALWHGIFSNAPSTVIAWDGSQSTEQMHKDFRVYSINGRICRYELARKQEGSYFFDYDLSTGEVTVSSPGR